MNNIQAVLAEVGEGTGCEFFIRPRHNVPVSVLAALGLVRPIARSAPRCHEHECPVLQTCEDRKRFEDRAGVANKKFHLLAAGHQAVDNPEVIRQQALKLPMGKTVLEALGGRPRSIFELHWTIAGPSLGQGLAGPDRAELLLVLNVLAETGAIAWTPGTAHIEPIEVSP